MRREFTNQSSPRVKGVRRLAKRTFRQRERLFLAEGPQGIREALAVPGILVELFATAEAEIRHPDVIERATAAQVPVYRVSGEVMGELAQTITPQGLLGVCRFVDVGLEQALPDGPRLVVVLAHVRDPGNAGTVLRTADAAGADVVIFTDACVDPYNAKCVRASAGSLFHVTLVVGVTVRAAAQALSAAGVRVLAADGRAPRTIDAALDEGCLAGPTAWVFGNEAWGLADGVMGLVDGALRVPIYGGAESLNLATAAAVCLYASARAQRVGGDSGDGAQ
ncbi:MAG: RNA methyltransferase [Streptosporangiales bacterium]|nr:RNA methyltransferase [Streptosporangiales bacterium]